MGSRWSTAPAAPAMPWGWTPLALLALEPRGFVGLLLCIIIALRRVTIVAPAVAAAVFIEHLRCPLPPAPHTSHPDCHWQPHHICHDSLASERCAVGHSPAVVTSYTDSLAPRAEGRSLAWIPLLGWDAQLREAVSQRDQSLAEVACA